MVFGVIGHPDQAPGGRREQQRADRRVEGPVGHVEQPLGVRLAGQAVMQGAQLLPGDGGQGIEQAGGLLFVTHWSSPLKSVAA